MRSNPVRKLLKSGKPAVGTWLSLGNIPAARFLARAGFDWLTVDIEHTLVGMETATHMFGGIADGGCVPLARVPSGRHDHIKRVLDNGSYGVVVPMVCSKQEADVAVRACLYPPAGDRSVGGSVHVLNFNATTADYFAKFDDEVLVVLQCEHIDAVRNFDEVFGHERIDAVFVGPNDLMATMRDATGKPPTPEAFEKALQDILAGCKRLGVAAGLHTFSVADAKKRIAEGWQFVAVNSELRFMTDGAKQTLDGLGMGKGAEGAKY